MEVQFTTWNFILMNFYWLQLRRIKLSTFGTWSPSISFPSLKRIRDLSGTKSREIVNEIKGFINQGLIQRQSVFGLWSMQKAKKAEDTATKFFLLTSFFLMDVCSIKCLGTKYCNLDPDFSIFFRTITFHSEGHCIFSGSHDSLKIHNWEPPTIRDNLLMGWGKIKDISIASTQLVSWTINSVWKSLKNVSFYRLGLPILCPMYRCTWLTWNECNPLCQQHRELRLWSILVHSRVMSSSLVKSWDDHLSKIKTELEQGEIFFLRKITRNWSGEMGHSMNSRDF